MFEVYGTGSELTESNLTALGLVIFGPHMQNVSHWNKSPQRTKAVLGKLELF